MAGGYLHLSAEQAAALAAATKDEELREKLTKLTAERPTAEQDFVAQAREQYQKDGEIDDNAIVSERDDGAYVMAWVWLDSEGSGEA
jgi:hypothetical protein